MTVSIDAADFASFIGTDAFQLNSESIASNATTGGGANVTVTQSPRAGCRATVTYTYTEAPGEPNPVPEPGSLRAAWPGPGGTRGAAPQDALVRSR